MTFRRLLTGVVLLAITASMFSCGPGRKLSRIRSGNMSAGLKLSDDAEIAGPPSDSVQSPRRDTLTVTDLDGRKVLVMRAVKDDETGEMVATEELTAAVVTSRFRNVAERHGKVDLCFDIIVPRDMHDSKWQLRFHPSLYMLGDSLDLDDVIVTGRDYRAAQLRGYQHYERFLSRIVTDTAKFVFMHQLEVFIERNLPEIYAFKSDSSYVSEEDFLSHYGVSEQQAVDHYTNWLAVSVNTHRKSRMDKMWRRYVKAPIVTEHIRLDTVIQDLNGDFIYQYVQTIHTKPKLRKVDIVLDGDIWEQDRRIYTIPRSEPLTFYISSLSAFVDDSERYLTKVIERRSEAVASWKIDFRTGKADVEEDFRDNRKNLDEIRMNFRNLLVNEIFDLDSCIISASASPEGSLKMNDALSERRAKAVADYFNSFTEQLRDSLNREAGLVIAVGDDLTEGSMTGAHPGGTVSFKSRSAGENWDFLDAIVGADTLMTDAQKARYRSYAAMKDIDARERAMQKESWYPRMKNDIYPRLRTVQFNFVMHRRGMIKDTVHTTELDTIYMRGVQAIRDRDYEQAAWLLGPYNDYNTAIAYVSLDRNVSAMNILLECPRTARVNYMLAVLYARKGEDRDAVECYIRSCQQDAGFVHRGNLDPEISALIKKYKLNSQ